VSARTSRIDDAAGCDILVMATAAQTALVRPEWLQPGVHVSAMGADALGKREIGRPYPAAVRLFADLPEQSRRIGVFQGVTNEITSIGSILAGDAAGRIGAYEITM